MPCFSFFSSCCCFFFKRKVPQLAAHIILAAPYWAKRFDILPRQWPFLHFILVFYCYRIILIWYSNRFISSRNSSACGWSSIKTASNLKNGTSHTHEHTLACSKENKKIEKKNTPRRKCTTGGCLVCYIFLGISLSSSNIIWAFPMGTKPNINVLYSHLFRSTKLNNNGNKKNTQTALLNI